MDHVAFAGKNKAQATAKCDVCNEGPFVGAILLPEHACQVNNAVSALRGLHRKEFSTDTTTAPDIADMRSFEVLFRLTIVLRDAEGSLFGSLPQEAATHVILVQRL